MAMKFKEVSRRVDEFIRKLGISIIVDETMETFFKGDLDGKTIWISKNLTKEEALFNVLHLTGHIIQWSISEKLRTLGSKLHKNPDKKLLKRLQNYEWEANCYGLWILQKIGDKKLTSWLEGKYKEDMLYLTHFYVTGKKLKKFTENSYKYEFKKKLIPKPVPMFTPIADPRDRRGIVINF